MNWIVPKRFLMLAWVIGLSACNCSGDPGENEVNQNVGEPVVCDDHEDCEEEDERCILDEPGEEGECLALFEMREHGEACDQSRQCDTGLCYEDVCAVPCSDAGDCPDEMLCGESGVCEEPSPCDTDADCPDGGACMVTADEDSGTVMTICLRDEEGAETGEACGEHGDCRAGVCLDGMCTAPCDNDDQCHVLQVCEETSVSIDGEQGDLELCVERPPIDCAAALDCDFEELTCNTTFPAEGAVEGAVCGLTNPGENELGEECTAGEDCETDLCWVSQDQSTGECSVFCEEAERDCAGDQVCTSKAAGLGMCLASCETNADCDGENVCQFGVDPADAGMHTYCSLRRGEGETGDECASSDQCATGLCLTVVTYRVTEQSCQTDHQCDDGYECRCEPEDPNCLPTNRVCVSEEGTVEDRCSELCDAENGDADCADGGHDMTWCNDSVQVGLSGHEQTVAACSLEREEE